MMRAARGTVDNSADVIVTRLILYLISGSGGVRSRTKIMSRDDRPTRGEDGYQRSRR